MAVWYRAALQGTYQGQSIVNVLFYGDDAGDGFSVWDPAVAADVGESMVTTLVPAYLEELPTTYTLNTISVTGVNERCVTVSDYEVETTVEDPGVTVGSTEGQAQVAIIAFQTTKHSVAGRNVKRSYIAYGPLHDSAQSSDGAVEAGFATNIAPLITWLGSNLAGALNDYRPVRIGRTADPAPIALGKVTGVTLRPFASFRKSRKRRPSGV